MVETTTKPTMEYRYLGNTGLRVSVISFGYMLTDPQIDNQKFLNEAVQRALDNGINYFDTAEFYAFGEAEILLGNAFKAVNVKREEIVVSTKIFMGPGAEAKNFGSHLAYYQGKGVNSVGLSRKHIIEGARNSLKRLQLDYADIIFCHRPDPHTPIEEVCRAFNWLIEQGLAFYWGTSEWEAVTIAEAIQVCQRLNLHAPIVEQCQYNMLNRTRMEKDYRSLFEKYGYGTTVWSPLAQGFLAGRYNDGNIPIDSRAGKPDNDPFFRSFLERSYFTKEKKEKLLNVCRSLSEIAKEEGYSQAQVALAWVIANKDVSTLIAGFSKLEHIDQNVKALELYAKWNKTLEDKIETLLDNRPEAQIDFRKFAPFQHRRDIAVKESLQ